MPPEPAEAADTPGSCRLPQLSQLDKRDLDAVGGFWPRKLLGRTAALLLLVVIVLIYACVVDSMFAERLGIQLGTRARLLILGLPVLTVAAQVVWE